jgi:hypothetical protein
MGNLIGVVFHGDMPEGRLINRTTYAELSLAFGIDPVLCP